MPTFEEMELKMQKEFEEKKNELEKKREIYKALNQLPEVVRNPKFVHIQSLYSSKALIKYGDEYLYYSLKSDQPKFTPLEAFEFLSNNFEVMQVMITRADCTYITPSGYYRKEFERATSQSEFYGIYAEMDFYNQNLEAYVDLPEFGIIRVEVILHGNPLGVYRKEYLYPGSYDKGSYKYEALMRVTGNYGITYGRISQTGENSYQRKVIFWNNAKECEDSMMSITQINNP